MKGKGKEGKQEMGKVLGEEGGDCQGGGAAGKPQCKYITAVCHFAIMGNYRYCRDPPCGRVALVGNNSVTLTRARAAQ